jgi:hypothetical protein
MWYYYQDYRQLFLLLSTFCMLKLNVSLKSGLINTTGATSGAGTAYPSWAPEFTPGI